MIRPFFNHSTGTLLLVLALLGGWALPAQAAYKRMEMSDGSASSQVPIDFRCNEPNPVKALCFSERGVGLFITQYYTGPGFISAEQFVGQIAGSLEQQGAEILELYAAPEISQAIARQDADILYLSGQRVHSLWVKVRQPDGFFSIGVLVFKYIPNNGAAATAIMGYTLVYHTSLEKQYRQHKADLGRFVTSLTYKRPFLQALNMQHMQFLSRLSAREKAFRESQSLINQNNLSVLDSSFESFLRRSEANYAGHKRSVGVINETRSMVDQSTGQRFQVEGNFRRNFVNPNNIDQQMQTDNPLANPNINNNMGENYNELVEEN